MTNLDARLAELASDYMAIFPEHRELVALAKAVRQALSTLDTIAVSIPMTISGDGAYASAQDIRADLSHALGVHQENGVSDE